MTLVAGAGAGGPADRPTQSSDGPRVTAAGRSQLVSLCTDLLVNVLTCKEA